MDLKTPRDKIDKVDHEILVLLAKRFDIVQEVISAKKLSGEQPHQPDRYKQMLQSIIEHAKQLGLSEQFVRQIWDNIHLESMRIQREEL